MYTAALTSELQKEIVDAFRGEDSVVRVIVATVAFGMGIDCMLIGVRQVINVTCPESPESYAQETGRCGRDGQFSKASLFGSWPLPQVQPCGSTVQISTVAEVHSLNAFIDFDAEGARAAVSQRCCCGVCSSLCDCDSNPPGDVIAFLY